MADNTIHVDLSIESSLFLDNQLDFAHKVNFVYGKNGTGKSTLAKLILDQFPDKDVRIFDGFDGILGENHKLNAVVLGIKNVDIDNQIRQCEGKKSNLEKQKALIESQLKEPENGETNLWVKLEEAQSAYNDACQELDKFYSKAASEIKNINNPRIASINYNKNNFKDDIPNARMLPDQEIEKLKKLAVLEKKEAKVICFPILDSKDLMNQVQQLLDKKVKPTTVLERLEGNSRKVEFAREGLRLHKAGDICAFCGNRITENTINELDQYFSADEVKGFQNEINQMITSLNEIDTQIKEININDNEFYPEFQIKAISLSSDLERLKADWHSFLLNLINLMEEKKKHLFDSMLLDLPDLPNNFLVIEKQYDDLLVNNNSTGITELREYGQNSLKDIEVYKRLIEYDFDEKSNKLNLLKNARDEAQKNYEEVKGKIEPGGEIYQKIQDVDTEIQNLQSKTRNETILAENINQKLKHMVSFELVHDSDNDQGYYNIKDINTGGIRDITNLSTGERNIIAFLYFIEKLWEKNPTNNGSKNKIVVFDDPMTSNDESMQYLMIEVLEDLMNKLDQKDKFILLTHNKYFYLNVKYGYHAANSVRQSQTAATVIHLMSDGYHTHIKVIEKDTEDFKTSYEALWHELIYFYEDKNVAASVLLNPIRRIMETFTNFNALDLRHFCANQKGAYKLFNVNSHAIDDLEADVNGLTKDQIIQLMKGCFIDNKAEDHFNKYWKPNKSSAQTVN